MMETLRARAISLHRAGRFAEAERICDQVLRQSPADFDALHLLGVIAHQTGRHVRAVELLGRAIGLRNHSAAAHVSFGAALRDIGRIADAVASFDQAIALEPSYVDAYTSRGIALGRLQRNDEALTSFDRALALRPAAAELHNNRGNMLRRLRRFADALASFERAIALQPLFAMAYNNRGLVLQDLQRYEEAASSYQRALELQPNYADVHNNIGVLKYELNQPAAALESWRRALELRPRIDGVHGNLSNALRDLERPEEALAESELGMNEDPGSAVNHCNRGNALFDLGRFAEAIASYDRAIELDARYALAQFNKGLCLLLNGEFAQGLRLYEARKRLDSYPKLASSTPSWNGKEDIAGKTLLIQADQALGDTIQFCRYAKLAAERGAQVMLAVQPQLRELLAGLGPAIRTVGYDERPEASDLRCSLMSMPLAFGTTLEDIPAGIPYVFADPLRVSRWRQRLGDAGFKVGIVWQGSRNRIDVGRSVPLETFERLASVPGVRLISLQKETSGERLHVSKVGQKVEVLDEEFDSGPQAFLDSAAVMSHLDLIITCDTALAHLAGALGRPTWIVLKHVPDWRWFLERSDSPWYPNVRLFRQSRRGDWKGVFDSIRAHLTNLANPNRPTIE